MATDIAFVVGCLAVLGSRVPPALKIFMLSLAIIDDILAVIVIAAVFSSSINVVWLGVPSPGFRSRSPSISSACAGSGSTSWSVRASGCAR